MNDCSTRATLPRKHAGQEVSVSQIQLVTGCNFARARELHELIYPLSDKPALYSKTGESANTGASQSTTNGDWPCPFCGCILPGHKDDCYIMILSKALMEGVSSGNVSEDTAADLDATWKNRVSDTTTAENTESNGNDDLAVLASEIGDWLYFMVETDPGHVIVADDQATARDFRERLARLGVSVVE